MVLGLRMEDELSMSVYREGNGVLGPPPLALKSGVWGIILGVSVAFLSGLEFF